MSFASQNKILAKHVGSPPFSFANAQPNNLAISKDKPAKNKLTNKDKQVVNKQTYKHRNIET